MAVPRVEKAYEKHAWIVLFAIGVLRFLVATVVLLFGVELNPTVLERTIGMTLSELRASNPSFFGLYTYIFRFSVLFELGFVFLIITISATAYKRGEKWAWYALWSVPAFFIGSTAIVLSIGQDPSEFIPLMLFIILSLLGLLLPYRKFFPGK